MKKLFLTCAVCLAAGLTPICANAQIGGNRGSTGSSMGGSSGFGGGTSGLGSTGLGSSGSFGSSSFGQLGAGGFTSSGFGNTGMGGQQGGGLGMGGGLNGQQQGGGFLGGNNQTQFLGRSAQGQQNGMGANGMGANGMNQFGNNRGGGGNRGNLNTMTSLFGNNMGGNNNANSLPMVRPRQRVAFDYPVPKSDALQLTLKSQIERVALRNPSLTNVMITTNPGGEVVLRGAVKSEADAKLATNLLRLEPGVRSVRSELTFPNPVERDNP
jgi:hypothetical protein